MKAKLLGFITPQQVTYAYKKEDTSLPASYARAIAAYKFNHVQESLDLADSLINGNHRIHISLNSKARCFLTLVRPRRQFPITKSQ